ncbi:class I SAM-dependent methyltransferase [Pararhodospirillum photometricum]|uniref:class I SAM-dependent methyltransferase n=1 Tax=Pararhodospirillum photometricum TaxID=1084 RepID=UPI0012FF28E4|nr:class I SAM-dependent methyltransferase [Pararhodospirillum photometricum]
MTSEWTEGYLADVPYTDTVYQELFPSFLAFMCLLIGVRPPDLARGFRYCELGCGRGATLLHAAATHPHGDFVGIDFDPAAIASARDLAREAGLANVALHEEAFRDLAFRLSVSPGGVPDHERFDIVVLHGVYGWVAAENRQALVEILRHWVRPGGLVFISYNCRAGWAPLVPLQRLLVRHAAQSSRRGNTRIEEALAFLGQLRGGGASFFSTNPIAAHHLNDLERHHRGYLAHEYFNEYWDVFDHADIASAVASARLTFIGSATIPYNSDDLCLPAPLREIVACVSDPALAEMVRDLTTGRVFRRDIFMRGPQRLSSEICLELLRKYRFTLRRPINEIRLVFPVPLGELRGDPAIGGPILAALTEGTPRFVDLETDPKLAGTSPAAILRCLSLLVSSGQADIVSDHSEAAKEPCRRLNQETILRVLRGEDRSFAAAPLIGGALRFSPLEHRILAALYKGHPPDVSILLSLLQEQLPLLKGGSECDGSSALTSTLETVVAHHIPLWQRLGIV